MKRIIYLAIVVCLVVLLGYFGSRPAILFLAKAQLEKVFTGAEVSIGGCVIEPFKKLELFNLIVSKEPAYDFKVGSATFQFTLQSILKGIILKASLSEAAIVIDQQGESIQGFSRQLNLGGSKAAFTLDSLELSDIELDLESSEVSLKANLSLLFDVKGGSLSSCDINIGSLASAGFKLKNATLSVSQSGPVGAFSIAQATYSDVKLRNVKAKTRLKNNLLTLDSLSAQVLGGQAQGSAKLFLGRDMHYTANLEFIKLDLATIVRDFKLEEKVQLQGNLGGSFILEGSGLSIQAIGADMSADKEGGTLTIKDHNYLGALARKTNQSMELIVDSFKSYRYNAGVVKLSLQDANLVFDIKLEGEAGKRDLTVVLHDLNLTRGE